MKAKTKANRNSDSNVNIMSATHPLAIAYRERLRHLLTVAEYAFFEAYMDWEREGGPNFARSGYHPTGRKIREKCMGDAELNRIHAAITKLPYEVIMEW